jgi:hypothetical protein
MIQSPNAPAWNRLLLKLISDLLIFIDLNLSSSTDSVVIYSDLVNRVNESWSGELYNLPEQTAHAVLVK